MKKPIYKCLPNLQETLIESSKFPIDMSQNKGKVKKYNLQREIDLAFGQ